MTYAFKRNTIQAQKPILIAILALLFMPHSANAEGFADDGTIKFNHYKGDGLNNLWVFGDSMSDQSMNKLYNKNKTSSADITRIARETWNGRNANGKIWVDWLGEMSRIRTDERKNFAVSGARTDDDVYSTDQMTTHNPWGQKWNKMGMASQIRLAKENGLRFGKNDLATLWAGGNDFQQFINVDGVSTGTGKDFGDTSGKRSDKDIDDETTRIANQIGSNMDMLKSMNAQNILVPSWVNMTEVPSINTFLTASTHITDKANWKAKSNKFWNDYNTKLQQKLTQFSNDNPHISVYYVNLIKGYDYLLKNSEHWGIPKANLGKACNDDLGSKLKTGDQLNQNDCSKYVSWDGIHATSEVQKIIADAYNSVLQVPRLNAMMVQNINNQTQSLLDLTKPSISAMTTNTSQKFTVNSSAFRGGIGRSKIKPTDGIMQSKSNQHSLSAQYQMSKNMGVSVGYINNTTKTKEYAPHIIKQSTTVVSLYTVKKLDDTSHISTQGYFGYTNTPEIKRMVMLNKITMSGSTTANSYGGNMTYNKNITPHKYIYTGFNFQKTKIKGYGETAGLETGLGIRVGDINTNRTHLNMGFRGQSSTTSKYPYTFNLGVEFDINNKIDKYTFKSIDGNVPTHIKAQKLNQSALKFGIAFQPVKNTTLFLNKRMYKNGNAMNLGVNYNINF